MKFILINGLFLLVLAFVVFAIVIMEFRYVLKYAAAKSVSVSLQYRTENDPTNQSSL